MDSELRARHVEAAQPLYRGRPRRGTQCSYDQQIWPCDATRLLDERDAAVSARQEAERVLRAVLDANDAWQAAPEDDAPSKRAMVVAIRSARATLARTREPAGENVKEGERGA